MTKPRKKVKKTKKTAECDCGVSEGLRTDHEAECAGTYMHTKKKTKKKAAKKKTAKKGETKKAAATEGSLAERREKIRARYVKPVVIYESDTTLTYQTRFPRLNRLIGGLRAGAIVEVFGFEDSGKSSFTVAAAADVQRQAPPGKKHVVLANYEGPEPWEWWRTIGLDTSKKNFTQLRPRNLEEGMADVADLVQSGEVCAVIVDSVYAAAAKMRKGMLEKWAGNKEKGAALGVEAVRWGEAWTSLKGLFQDHEVVVFAVNQMREKIEIGSAPRKPWQGKPVTTPRGHALKFYAWVRLKVEGRWLVDSEGDKRKDVDGICMRVRVIKNKTSDEARGMVEYDLIRGFGFDTLGDLVALATEAGVIKHPGGGNYRIGSKKIRGKAKLREFVESSEKLQKILRAHVDRYLARLPVEDEPEDLDQSEES